MSKKVYTISLVILLILGSATAIYAWGRSWNMDMGMTLGRSASTVATTGFIWEDTGVVIMFEDTGATIMFEDIN